MKVNIFAAMLLSLLFSSLFLFPSCKSDPDPEPSAGRYEKGIFVVNEGPFGGTGTITWHDPTTGETVQDIYGQANNGAALGAFVQSLAFHNGKGYIAVGGANRLVVVDAATFEYLDTIGGFILPRFFQPLDNDYAYVSQWGAGGVTGSIAKVDLHTNKIVKTIPTGAGPEKMLLADGILWVANSGGYGLDSTVAHIFTGTENGAVRETIPGQRNPACLAKAGGVSTYPFAVLCKGDYTDLNSLGWLTRADAPNTPGLAAIPGADDLVASPDGSTYYFINGGAIYALDNAGLRKGFDQSAYGLACDPTNGQLYCADAKGFTGNGEVVIVR
ncbi:MAG: DUF5074 domain-containing protein [Saprospiraceae bacterium]